MTVDNIIGGNDQFGNNTNHFKQFIKLKRIINHQNNDNNDNKNKKNKKNKESPNKQNQPKK